MRRIIGFSGKYGCGKTTLSIKFAEDINAKLVSFGEYIRDNAKQRELDYLDREVLRKVGKEQINLGWPVFCEKMLKFFNYNNEKLLVVDGVRHVGCLDGFRVLYPDSNIYVVYVEISDILSAERQKNRGDKNIYTYNGRLHVTEEQVINTIPSIADIILDGNNEIAELRLQLKNWYINL